MKNYEAIREIFNQCPNNQMRDVFIEEIETDDPDSYVLSQFKDKEITWDKIVREDGTIVYDIMTAGIHQRYTLSEF